MRNMFRSLSVYNYRVWASGAIVSNVGTWMQRVAQDWIVLTQLTHNDATAVGITTAFQFAPQLIFLPFTGYAADHLNRRKLLIVTQSTMGLLALGIGILTVTGLIQLWEVYAFAFLLGSAAAFDSPARQTFVGELVDGEQLTNAVGLNSTSFNMARMIGPAVAGVLITAVGSGWVFIINAASFGAVLISFRFLKVNELHPSLRASHASGGFVEGFRYVWRRPDLKVIMIMMFLIGTFGLNFPIYISTMAVSVFHKGAGEFGLLTSIMAVGTVAGALLAARRQHPRLALLLVSSAVFAIGCLLASISPSYTLFGLSLIIIGISAQTLTTSSTTILQLSTDPIMRGRVIAIFLAVALGGTPIGAPIVGWVANTYGPRWGLVVGAASGVVAAFVGLYYLIRYRNLRLIRIDGHLSFTIDAVEPVIAESI